MNRETAVPAAPEGKGRPKGSGLPPAGSRPWIAVFWLWTIPSALFWALALGRDVFLPDLPRGLWIWPGEVWRVAPWLFVILNVAIPCLIIVGARRWPKPVKITRPLAYILLTGIALVHILWGGAILSL
jgi:hypothetical protein